MKRIKVMIVDKQIFFRMGLCQALSQEPDLELLDCAPASLMTVIYAESPNVILMDIDYPSIDGIELCSRVVHSFPNTSVVILTPNPSDDEIVEVIKSGAVGYLSKDVSVEKLVNTVRQASRGEYLVTDIFAAMPNAAEQILKQFRGMVLMLKAARAVGIRISLREMQVLNYIARGKSNKQIAHILQLSEQTVKNHVSSILHKLKANDRAHAVALAIRSGWITDKEELLEWSRLKDHLLDLPPKVVPNIELESRVF